MSYDHKCGQKMYLENPGPDEPLFRFCLLYDGHKEDHLFEKSKHTLKKLDALMILQNKINPKSQSLHILADNQFSDWDQEKRIFFGLRFLQLPDLNWTREKRISYLNFISGDSSYYVKEVLKLEDELGKAGQSMKDECQRDLVVKQNFEDFIKLEIIQKANAATED